MLCPDDDPSLGSKLVAIYIELFTSQWVVIMIIYTYCIYYTNGEDVLYKIYLYFYGTSKFITLTRAVRHWAIS